MAKQPKICMDMTLPEELQEEAALRALEENPANGPQPGVERLEIAVLKKKLWKPGRTLRVCFLDGDPSVQAKVETVAHQWSEFANIKFDFGSDPNAEIRISFTPDGSWSYVGTDALSIPASEPTMNYGWLDANSSDNEISRVVLHEFGHALGAIHEHQHPKLGFTWFKDAVYKYYMAPPNSWTKEQVDFNVLNRYSETVTQYSDFDTRSIMLYPIPQEHTCGDFAVTWRNTALSEKDKEFIQQIYPFV